MLQLRVLRNNPTMPLKLKRVLDPNYYARARAYRLDRVRFAIVQGIVTHMYTMVSIDESRTFILMMIFHG